jgi:hypothetical protein
MRLDGETKGSEIKRDRKERKTQGERKKIVKKDVRKSRARKEMQIDKERKRESNRQAYKLTDRGDIKLKRNSALKRD